MRRKLFIRERKLISFRAIPHLTEEDILACLAFLQLIVSGSQRRWCVKLLFDENLSPRLVELLQEVYPESQHVHDLGLGGVDDSTGVGWSGKWLDW